MTTTLVEKINNNVQKQGRLKLVRIRIRNGKIQRRKKLSNTKGYTLRGGRLIRMSSKERMDRRRGARKAKIKLRSKRAQILRHRKQSLRKRHQMGL